MTTVEKYRIQKLREQGHTYRQIASIMDMPDATVKSFCRRNLNPNIGMCKQCGKKMELRAKTKRKHFCSDSCRMKWWNAHPEVVTRRAYYDLTCVCCGQPFQSYGNRNRKYCGRACFGMDRRKAVVT